MNVALPGLALSGWQRLSGSGEPYPGLNGHAVLPWPEMA